MTDLAQLIADVRFEPVRLQDGYDMGEVDYFLDRLEAAVSKGEPVAPLLEEASFKEVRLREGYAIEDVDRFLAEVRAAVSTPAPAPPVIVEQRGLLARLFRRR